MKKPNPKKKLKPDKLPKPVKEILKNIHQIPQNTVDTKYHKRPPNDEIIKALISTRNNKSEACKLLNVDRGTLKNWLDTDSILQVELKNLQDELLEWVISKEFELIEGVHYYDPKVGKTYKLPPCWRSIQHYLDSQAKHLGFGQDKASKTDIKINNSNASNQRRIILELPRNDRNTITHKDST